MLQPIGLSPVERVRQLGMGRNSRVHLVEGGGRRVVVKQYHRQGAERSPRQEREYYGLEFLTSHGVQAVPAPLYNDFESGLLVLAHLEGTPASATPIEPSDIVATADFLVELRALCKEPDSARLAVATDAAFRLRDLESQIAKRIQRLLSAPEVPAVLERAFRSLVEGDLQAAFTKATEGASGAFDTEPLPTEARLLSPSDLGFHNAIRTNAGLAFVDFEHFGWDDPAKTIADFVLHPGMELEPGLRGEFAEALLERFCANDAGLRRRTVLLGPLYAVKWATILLNEFLPESAARRAFAGVGLGPDEGGLERQLYQSRRMLVHGDDFARLARL